MSTDLCQDCHHDRSDHAAAGAAECATCLTCREFLPSQEMELRELAQRMCEEPGFDPGWPFGALIRERGWAP